MNFQDVFTVHIDGSSFIFSIEYNEIDDKPIFDIESKDLEKSILSNFDYYDMGVGGRVIAFSGNPSMFRIFDMKDDYFKLSNISYQESIKHDIEPKWFISVHRENENTLLWYGSTGNYHCDGNRHFISFKNNKKVK